MALLTLRHCLQCKRQLPIDYFSRSDWARSHPICRKCRRFYQKQTHEREAAKNSKLSP